MDTNWFQAICTALDQVDDASHVRTNGIRLISSAENYEHKKRLISSDNYLSLREMKDGRGRVYILAEYFTDGQLVQPIGTFTNLRAALIASEKYQQTNEVEYGLSFFPITD